jgi:GNAT superfamily N-acetyltransferase
MHHELRHRGYLISDNAALINGDAVHAYISRSYWAQGVPREIVARSIAHSLNFGIYSAGEEQVGLVRVISDYATFAYLCDVYVLEAHRGQGLAKAALRLLQTHPKLQGIRRMQLVTQDAQGLYAQFGFAAVKDPERHMERRIPNAYAEAIAPRS